MEVNFFVKLELERLDLKVNTTNVLGETFYQPCTDHVLALMKTALFPSRKLFFCVGVESPVEMFITVDFE